MGRKNSIDRAQVLEAAEKIVSAHGAGALTIDAVAKAAGITKGGVQSCFGTKEGLVEAMLGRWIQAHEKEVAQAAPAAPTPLDLLKLHIHITASDDEDAQRRVAGLLSVLLQSPSHLGQVREWYQTKIKTFAQHDDQHAMRTAFLATEGAFFLRYLGLVDFTSEEWKSTFLAISDSLHQ
jgi:AcrR family transcriptional regulator